MDSSFGERHFVVHTVVTTKFIFSKCSLFTFRTLSGYFVCQALQVGVKQVDLYFKHG